MVSRKVPARLPEGNSCKVFLQRIPARHSCKAFLQGIPARQSCKAILQGNPARAPRVPSKVQARQSQQGIVVFNCLPQNKKRKKQKKAQRKCRSCLHIGSRKVAKLFQQSSNQTSNITTRHIKQSKKQYKKTNDVHPCSGSLKDVPARGSSNRAPRGCSKVSPGSSTAMFQQGSSKIPARFQQGSSEVPAKFQQRFQQGSSKVPGLFRFFGVCIFVSPLPFQRLKPSRIAVGS